MAITDAEWKKLKRKLQREKRSWENTNLNKPGRDVAAAMTSAYGGVLRMMERIEEGKRS